MKRTVAEERIQRVTSKGQITLPSAWRKENAARNVIVRARGRILSVAPVRFVEDNDAGWTVIFNKDRDNNGKGIPVDEFIRILEKHKKQDEKARKVTPKAKRKK